MGFDTEYRDITDIVKADLDCLENELGSVLSKENPLSETLYDFIKAPSKRLRPVLSFLFLRCIFDNINSMQMNLISAVELIHNATLIHDDVIDNSETRRNKESVNSKFDANLAVIAGDFLLSVAMEKVINTGSLEVLKLCTSALKSTCLGEVNQYFSKFKMVSMDNYVQKSKEKTAYLFEIGILGGLLLSESSYSGDKVQLAKDFSQNFGIAFQIRDDLINVLNYQHSTVNDLNSGIYTAPVIFAQEEDKNILKSDNIFESIKNTRAIEKTKDLMDNYFDKSILGIESLENSAYKTAILRIIDLLRREL